jgi:hypothetical protein
MSKSIAVFSSAFFTLFLALATDCASMPLPVPVKIQEHSQWCWAATSSAVLEYYGTPIAQCSIANYSSRLDSCCGNYTFEWDNACNNPNYLGGHGLNSGDIQDILQHWGVYSTYTRSTIPQEVLVTDIDYGRPDIILVQWANAQAHFVVIRGYDLSGNFISYMDPYLGYRTDPYTSLVSTSDGTRYWIESLRTPLPAVATLPATSITGSSAVLGGSVSPNNVSTAVTFEYGTTNSYGSSVTADQSPINGSAATLVSKTISSLAASTTYHYRVKKVNSFGTSVSSDAIFTTASPTLTVNKLGTGTGTVNAYNLIVEYKFTATSDPGSVFTGWSGDCSGTGTGDDCYILLPWVTHDIIVNATFDRLPPVNGVCGSANGQTLTATPTTNLCNTGSSSAVTGNGPWNWTCSGTNGGTQSPQCTAAIQTYQLNVIKMGNGIVIPNTGTLNWINILGTGIYNYGTTVTLTATPNPGNIFTGWSGACSGKGPCNVTMSAPQSVSATFVPDITPILNLLLN